jgi:hypothetical protein
MTLTQCPLFPRGMAAPGRIVPLYGIAQIRRQRVQLRRTNAHRFGELRAHSHWAHCSPVRSDNFAKRGTYETSAHEGSAMPQLIPLAASHRRSSRFPGQESRHVICEAVELSLHEPVALAGLFPQACFVKNAYASATVSNQTSRL